MERRKREEDRRKAVAVLSKKSPKSHHLTIEQRHYQMKIKELRAKSERRSNNNNSDPETDSSAPEEKDREREPHLTNITSEYDLKLFQEAQAAASEKIVSLHLPGSMFGVFFVWNFEVHEFVHKSLSLDLVLSHFSPVIYVQEGMCGLLTSPKALSGTSGKESF